MTRRRSNVQIVTGTGQIFITRSVRNECNGICKPVEGSDLPGACNVSRTALAKCRQPLLREEAQKN
jgi:hypothetical protein